MKTLLLSTILLFTVSLNAQDVYIPDAIFKSYLVNNPSINTSSDSEIQVSEAIAFTGTISCANVNISDLTGIEAFTALTELYCGDDQLTSLDVSNCTALTYLNCRENNISSLNVSNNNALIVMICDENNMSSLNVSNNNALTTLTCDENNLTSLDVSNCTALTYLYCDDNQITSLNLSNNTALTKLHCHNNQLQCLNVKNGNNTAFINFFTNGNFNLSCIEVDDVNYSTTNWTSIGGQASFSTDCNNACSSSLDITELNNTPKQLIKIVDVLGRETPFKPNTPLLYIYNDGTVERKVVLK